MCRACSSGGSNRVACRSFPRVPPLVLPSDPHSHRRPTTYAIPCCNITYRSLTPRPAPSFLLAPSAFSFSLSFNTLVSVFVSSLNSSFNSRTPSRPCLVCLYQLVQHHLNLIASSSVFRLRPAFSRLRNRNRWSAPVCVLSVCTFVLSPTFPREALRPSDSEPPVLGL